MDKCWFVAWLVGWLVSRLFAAKKFLPFWDNIYECLCYHRCHGIAVKVFWALWNNIYYCEFFTTLEFCRHY
jgi:hypothetical protein